VGDCAPSSSIPLTTAATTRARRAWILIQSKRRPFRRFRDELESDPDEQTRFHQYADERQRGRARRWLADHGLRSTGRSYG